MNTLNKRLLSTLAAAVLAGVYSNNVLAADATGNASATVLTPLSIAQTTAMNFGQVAGDQSVATTVVLANTGGTSSADGAYTDGAGVAGGFDVWGDTGQTYTITLPADGVVTLTGPGAAMSVDGFSNNLGATGTVDGTTSDGAADFTVGATLTINAGQVAGAYTGTYTVTVNYQ